MSVTFELIDASGRSWGRPAELDNIVAGAQVCVMPRHQFEALGLQWGALAQPRRPIHAANGSTMDAVGHSRCRFSSRTATGRIAVAFAFTSLTGLTRPACRATP